MKQHRTVPRLCAPRLPTLLSAALLLSTLAFSGRAALARPTQHPHYDDGRTLRWYASFDEARRVATREGKLILVEVSPANSPVCGKVVGLIRDPAIRGRIARLAIGHHVDPRGRSRLVSRFRANLPPGSRLPWMGLFAPDATLVAGFAPERRTTLSELRRRLLLTIERGEAEQRRLRESRGTGAAPRASSTKETPEVKSRAAPRTSSRRGASSPASTPKSAPRPARASSTGPATSLIWYEKISEARVAARDQGKMILVTSTKASCSLCKKLRNRVIPQVWREMSKGCVFYVYDITKPESRAVDRIVRANLPNARLMPLSGFMTHDGRWLQGFFGATDTRQLMADYRTAMRRR